MGSEQIFIDDKHVGEIIQLDETWTIKIEYGYYEKEKYGYFNCETDPFKLTKLFSQHKEVMDSFGKIERLECNCRLITLFKNDELISFIIEGY